MRIVIVAALFLVMPMFAGASADVSAQGKKAKCSPNFMSVCMERCAKRGGQGRLCPQWCSKQQREKCG
jgi:hypothetical protein